MDATGTEPIHPSSRAFQPILETALDAVVIIDTDGIVIGWNDCAEETFGWSGAEARGRPLADLVVPEQHKSAHRAGFERYLRTGEAHVLNQRIEITARRKDGREVPVELAITTTDFGDGQVFIGYLRDISDRREAEQAARQQASILAQLTEGVIVADAAGKVTYLNEAAARLHGAAELGVTPDRYSEAYHLYTLDGRPHPADELPLVRALRGETVQDARWKVQRPDGTSVLAVGTAQPILDPNGAQVAAAVTVRDETARHDAEQQVRENEARLRALTDNLPSGMVFQISTGADGSERRFLFVSQSHQQLTGIPAEAVLRDPTIPYQLIHPDDRAAVVEAERLAILNRAPFDVQVRFRRADGEERWCRILSAPRDQEDGSLIWDGLQIDITERVAAQSALVDLNRTLEQRVAEGMKERNLLATLVETTDVMVMACDFDYNILAINNSSAEEFERVYGVRPRARDNLLELLGDWPEHRAEVQTGWSRALAGEEATFVDELGDKKLDRPSYEISFRTLRDTEGKPIGAYQFVSDVTPRLTAEAQLVEAHEALRQSQKMEALGQLTGGVAHDFNNLLTPIVGALDLLLRRGLGSERERKLIAGAMQSADRATTLVQRLLAFARRQPLQATAVDLAALVVGMAGLIESTLGPNIDMRLAVDEALPPACADANQLEMALLNLAVNARDAMPDGGVLTIAAMREKVGADHMADLSPGDYLRLSVSDTGMGMDTDTARRAIEPFFSTKGVGKGTGLGLSMVHGLAAQLGGGVTLTSAPGEGTTVDVWLPLSAGQPAEETPAPAAAPLPSGRGRALLVDDELLVRMSTCDMLTELGYAVTEAGSGEAALSLLEAGETYDLLVTDQLMAGMSGLELAEKAVLLIPDLPVLIASGYSESDDSASRWPRLTKPFRKSDLADHLAKLQPDERAGI